MGSDRSVHDPGSASPPATAVLGPHSISHPPFPFRLRSAVPCDSNSPGVFLDNPFTLDKQNGKHPELRINANRLPPGNAFIPRHGGPVILVKNRSYIIGKLLPCLTALLIFLLLQPCAWAVKVPQLHFELKDSPYRVWGDEVTVDHDFQIVTIKGHVRIRQEDRLLTADLVRIYNKEKWAEAEGNVVMDTPQGVMKASWVYIDFARDQGKMRYGNIFIRQGNYRFSGEEIDKTGENTYYALNSVFTTCNGPNPAWSFKGREIELKLDDKATIRGAKFEIKGVPVLYTPWFSFPTKRERKSGFLLPAVGYSNRYGATFDLPFFWAISQNSDLTFYPETLTRTGERMGAEYRYILSRESKGVLNLGYLYESKEDEDLYNNGFSRQNKNRYWIRSRVNQTFGNDIKAKVDLDLASDQNYLREFKNYMNGFNPNSRYYFDVFGRNLEDDTALFRTTTASVVKNWGEYNFTGGVQYFQGLTSDESYNENAVQRLPTASFTAPLNPLAKLPLYYSFNTNYNYFYREEGARGNRLVIAPGLSWPIVLGRYATAVPFATAGESLYYTEGNDPDVDNGMGQRLYSGAGLELSSYISRVYNFSFGGVTKLKHIIKPLVTYECSAISQSGNLPEFEPADVADSINRVTYELRNDVTAKIVGPKGRTVYRDVMRFRLLQSYDIKESQRELFGPDDDRKPFSNIRGELELYPFSGVAVLADTTFSPYDGEFKTFNTYVRAGDLRGDIIQLDYRYTKDSVEEFNAFMNVRVTSNFDLLGYSKTSLNDSTTVEAGAGFGLRFQCWGIRFLYSNNSDEQSVGLTFSLAGLGDIQGLSFGI